MIDTIGIIKQAYLFKLVKKCLWKRKGCPIPPPHCIKEEIVYQMGRQFSLENFVETGTFKGDMVFAVKNRFRRVHSVEVHKPFFEAAQDRFKRASNVTIHLGDSTIVLPEILKTIDTPILFWLDGHYCGPQTGRGILDSPIDAELAAIAGHPCNNVILIDDARDFKGINGYPTIEELQKKVEKMFPTYTFTVENDIICIKPSVEKL